MHARPRPARFALLLTAAVLAFPLPGASQELRWTSLTRVEMGGALGAMAAIMGQEEPSENVVWFNGTLLRTDSGDESSTILDLGEGSIVVLDHGNRSYMRFSLPQMRAMMEEGRESMAANPAMAPGGAEGGVEYTTTAWVERRGEEREVLGYLAERVVVVAEVEAHGQAAQGPLGARFAMVNDVWISADFPAFRAMQESVSGGTVMQDYNAGGMVPALPGGSGIVEAMTRVQEELKEVEGMQVESVSYLVALGEDELDLEAVLGSAGEPIASPSGGGSTMDRMRSAMEGLMRQAEGGGAGGAGNGGQIILMRTTDRITSVEEATLPATVFQIPEGYRETPFPGGR